MIDDEQWQHILDEVIANSGVVMVLGAVDTGKTHFCVRLCNALRQANIPTAVVDADVGQSEIGAPGTIGMAIVDREVEALSDLKPKRLYFIGVTSPVGHMLESVVGTRKMLDAAKELGARAVVIDTTGLVAGYPGRKLKTYKIDLVRPNYLIGIQKKREIEQLLVPFSTIPEMKIRRLNASPEVRRKPPEFRAARRRLNFHRHFHDSQGHIIRLDDIACWNTWFGTGRPMKWQYIKFIEDSIKCRVLHAEVTGTGIFIVSEGSCRLQGRRLIEEEFKTRNITLVTGSTFSNLLVGLADETGRTLNVALLQAIDFKQRFMFVLSPIRTITPVRVVQFGGMRVTRAGEELGMLRPGEI